MSEVEEKIYTEADLVAFGNYLLSPERVSMFELQPGESVASLVDRMSRVNHADIVNFIEKSK